MIRKSFGNSGYQLKKSLEGSDTDKNLLKLWSPSYSVILLLNNEEAQQLVDDIKKEFEIE